MSEGSRYGVNRLASWMLRGPLAGSLWKNASRGWLHAFSVLKTQNYEKDIFYFICYAIHAMEHGSIGSDTGVPPR